jgi:hypothetical protein
MPVADIRRTLPIHPRRVGLIQTLSDNQPVIHFPRTPPAQKQLVLRRMIPGQSKRKPKPRIVLSSIRQSVVRLPTGLHVELAQKRNPRNNLPPCHRCSTFDAYRRTLRGSTRRLIASTWSIFIAFLSGDTGSNSVGPSGHHVGLQDSGFVGVEEARPPVR